MTRISVLQHFRITLPGQVSIGPGKAALLEAIARTGSISAAGRSLSMSYKRAWSLVEELNAAFALPLVESSRGGATGGGATLTPTGEEVLTRYQAMKTKAESACRTETEALVRLLAPQAAATDIDDGK